MSAALTQSRPSTRGVVILADERMMRSGLTMSIERFVPECRVAYSGSSADQAMAALSDDDVAVALIDADGADKARIVEALQAFARRDVTVVALTTSDSSFVRLLMQRAGATVIVNRMVDDIQRVLEAVSGRPLADQLGVSSALHPVRLSAAQEKVLMRFAQGFSVAAIADEMGVSPNSVRTHLKRLRAKYSAQGIEVGTRADLYRVARDAGIVQ